MAGGFSGTWGGAAVNQNRGATKFNITMQGSGLPVVGTQTAPGSYIQVYDDNVQNDFVYADAVGKRIE